MYYALDEGRVRVGSALRKGENTTERVICREELVVGGEGWGLGELCSQGMDPLSHQTCHGVVFPTQMEGNHLGTKSLGNIQSPSSVHHWSFCSSINTSLSEAAVTDEVEDEGCFTTARTSLDDDTSVGG